MNTPISDLVGSYSAEHRHTIDFAWNGKHSTDFLDRNQETRWAVVEYCLSNPSVAPIALLEHLFEADANWAAEAWGAPDHFEKLGALLLERGGEQVLPAFAESVNRSFDTFGACHAMSLPPEVAAPLSARSLQLASAATDEHARANYQATAELLAKLTAGTAASGWVALSSGGNAA